MLEPNFEEADGLGISDIKSLVKAEVIFIPVSYSFFFENPQKFHQKSQICKTPLTGGVAKTIHQNKK